MSYEQYIEQKTFEIIKEQCQHVQYICDDYEDILDELGITIIG